MPRCLGRRGIDTPLSVDVSEHARHAFDVNKIAIIMKMTKDLIDGDGIYHSTIN